MIWECPDLLASELWPEGIPPGCRYNNTPDFFIQQRKEMVLRLSQPTLGQATPPPIGSQQQELIQMWYETAFRYSRMNLTKASDTLVAIRGLADLMGKYLSMRYFCGHWEEGIIQSMLWSGGSARGGNGQPLIAPSWSWASVQEVKFEIKHLWDNTDSLVAEFLGSSTDNPPSPVAELDAAIDNPQTPEHCCLNLRGQVYRIGSAAGDMLSWAEGNGSASIKLQSEDSIIKNWNDEYGYPYLCCRIDAHRLESFNIEDYIDTQVTIKSNEGEDEDMQWHSYKPHKDTRALFCIWLWVGEYTSHGLLLRQVGPKAQGDGKEAQGDGTETQGGPLICERIGTIWRMTGRDTLQILKGPDSGRKAQELYLI